MIKTIESGDKISSIILNGGTTYNHTIDEIKAIVDLRNYMTEKYELDYKPHIHVDSVIGWS
jgi:glutamate/tyrosine decarboxylase-like PLP-dependent enzyme